jgi:hypothetical protein
MHGEGEKRIADLQTRHAHHARSPRTFAVLMRSSVSADSSHVDRRPSASAAKNFRDCGSWTAPHAKRVPRSVQARTVSRVACTRVARSAALTHRNHRHAILRRHYGRIRNLGAWERRPRDAHDAAARKRHRVAHKELHRGETPSVAADAAMGRFAVDCETDFTAECALGNDGAVVAYPTCCLIVRVSSRQKH